MSESRFHFVLLFNPCVYFIVKGREPHRVSVQFLLNIISCCTRGIKSMQTNSSLSWVSKAYLVLFRLKLKLTRPIRPNNYSVLESKGSTPLVSCFRCRVVGEATKTNRSFYEFGACRSELEAAYLPCRIEKSGPISP